MRLLRVGPLPETAIEAAARFYEMLPGLLTLDPPPPGEVAARSADGGGESVRGPLHPRPAAGGSPPPVGEDWVLVFPPASHEHAAWRLAAVQDLARIAVPHRVNGIAGNDEAAIAEAVAYLAAAPGVTGQVLAVDS